MGASRPRPRPRIAYPDPEIVSRDDALEAWLEPSPARPDVSYPVATVSAFEVSVPYVAAVHDLQHLLQPEFPEVSADGEAESREYLFRNLVRSSLLDRRRLGDGQGGRARPLRR